MGRYRLYTTAKTYSKCSAKNDNNNSNNRKLYNKSKRKPLPKFEDLFIRKRQNVFIDSSTENKVNPSRKPAILDTDSSAEIISSGDAFDSLLKIKDYQNCNNVCTAKETTESQPFKVLSDSSNSYSFLSAVYSPNTKVSEIFPASLLKSHEDDGKLTMNSENLVKKNENKISSKKVSECLMKDSVTLKVTSSILPVSNPLCILTSTPNIMRNVRTFCKDMIPNSEISPVNKDMSIGFGSSLSGAYSPFISCNLDKYSLTNVSNSFKMNVERTTEVKSTISHEYKKCSNLSKDFFSISEDNSVGSLNTLQNRYPSFRSFCNKRTTIHKVPRRRKILNTPRIEIGNVSDSSNTNFSEFYNKQQEQSAISSVNNSVHWVKSGKGWQRSLKKLSLLKLQSSGDPLSASCTNFCSRSRLSVLQSNDRESNIIVDPRSLILNLCSQETEVALTDCFSEGMLENCRKIGEGLYGEVFMAQCSSDQSEAESRVLKLMPVEGDFEVNGEPQKSFTEIAAELVVAMELSNLKNSEENLTSSFVNLYKCWLLKGSYPSDLLKLWDEYAKTKGSENDRPDMYPEDQLHILLEFAFAGQDLEQYIFNNAMQAYSCFVQIAYALSVAEISLEFEHRDLHWGNVLITTTPLSFIEYRVNGQAFKVKTNGVKATIIDFTLSRMKVNNQVYYNNLANDPTLFISEGDYQFEVYRKMRLNNGNNWEKFQPKSNIFWLHYIILKMINDCYYKNKFTKIHKEGIHKLKKVCSNILSYKSAYNFMEESESLP